MVRRAHASQIGQQFHHGGLGDWADESLAVCRGLERRRPARKRSKEDWGDLWTRAGIDADTKLVVSYLVGGRDAGWVKEFMEDCASRINAPRPGHHRRSTALILKRFEGAFGVNCAL